MNKRLVSTALLLPLAVFAGVAFASDDKTSVNAPKSDWLTIQQVVEKYTSQGYDVRKVEAEHDGYELEAIDKSGKRMEFDIHPVTGEALKQKVED